MAKSSVEKLEPAKLTELYLQNAASFRALAHRELSHFSRKGFAKGLKGAILDSSSIIFSVLGALKDLDTVKRLRCSLPSQTVFSMAFLISTSPLSDIETLHDALRKAVSDGI